MCVCVCVCTSSIIVCVFVCMGEAYTLYVGVLINAFCSLCGLGACFHTRSPLENKQET